VELEFLPAAPALHRHVSVYYRIRIDQAVVEDIERADVGYLRFFLSGSGVIRYTSGRTDGAHPIALMAPGTEVARYRLNGPLDCFGCVLLPDFWGSIADLDASSIANHNLDATIAFGPAAAELFDRLKSMESMVEMAKALDAFLITRIRPIPEDQVQVIDRIGDWLRGFPIPPTEILYAGIDKSPRQILRLANRHFGAAPKMLARKFRGLRTASRLIGTRGVIPEALVAEYSDRAHLTREIKYFTGLTPKQLQVNASPIVQATLHPDNFRAEAPWT
jgi:hypothetical protein